ncbi:ankyrin repeat-containing domain protein [Boletus edulis BED1]|uniref:Ankyrin repeat-containing domain protein n=1 Tax=Boletus edulis BED1 TaxID=1328754 RepID=A0AAD4BV02_BOLED|nr:ankyrin repeat-containing domain protein [Boletus edulis BED1]
MSDDKNIWVAAADGDVQRVQTLAISPNAPDPFTYTPMHAAASYAQLDVLAYLVQQGGDVNITDEDGDTPLYTVENIDTARWLIDHGAAIDRRNGAGVSPIEHIQEDFPEVAAFLQSRLDPSAPLNNVIPAEPQLSQHSQNAASETLTSNLIQSVSDIMQRAEAQGTDPDQELRAAVSQTVLDGVLTGYELSTQDGADTNTQEQLSKRSRMNGFHDP